jgi:drug/metabolite transporter (DMT)-like permease
MPAERRAPSLPLTGAAAESRGLWLGLLGVAIFAMTLPMTRLAVGPADAPQLPPLFVTAGRAALAALLSIAFLRLTGAARPPRRLWPALLLCAAGTVIGFPLFLALALRHVDAMHAAVVTGLLPLATAAIAALAFRQRPAAGFWACALAGSGLVVAFAAWAGGGRLSWADGLLLLAILSAAAGYVAGATASRELTAEQVICWVLVLSLPLTAPLMLLSWPSQPASAGAWAGFAYVTLFSMWLGFFAWYRGLALGGTVRVSQVQLLQPFLALLFAVPILGERLQPLTLLFSLAVIGTVFLGRRMPVRAPAPSPR